MGYHKSPARMTVPLVFLALGSLFVGYLMKDLTNIYWYLIIISAVKSWFNVFVSHPIFELIDELCEPLYKVVRNILPTFSGIDFSPIVLLFSLQIVEIIFIPRIVQLGYII